MRRSLKVLHLGRYPYTYARVSVMRSRLLGREDYHRLLKMSLSEIAGFLQGTDYKGAVDELGLKYSGVGLLEMALNRNLVDTWGKLKRISADALRLVIQAYLLRVDVWNVKAILRGIHAKESPDSVRAMLLPAGQLSVERLEFLLKSESVEDFLRKLNLFGLRFELFRDAFDSFIKSNSIAGFEEVVDSEYYAYASSFAGSLPSQGRLFRKFLEAELEMLNIINILRLRRAGVDRAGVLRRVSGSPSAFVRALLKSESSDDAARVLSQRVSEASVSAFLRGSLSEAELEFGRSLLARTRLMLHQHPLSVDVILGYMFAKEVEVRNLKMLIKSSQLGLGIGFAEQQLII